MQAKRIQVGEGNDGAAGRTSVILDVPTEPREEVNFHNIWIGVSVEPQNADANAQGTWVLEVIRDPGSPIPVYTDTFLNTEDRNALIVACGVWSASNQSPFNLTPTQIKTSRNIEAGGRLLLTSTVTGITAGTASNRVMLCAHVVRK